jgi:predicted component of type VI protein secretion system
VDAALADAALDLDLLYASYRGTWEHLRARLEQAVSSLEPAARAAAARALAVRYPAALQEPQFQETTGAALPAVAAGAPAAAVGGSDRLLATFAESYLPPASRGNAAADVAGEALLGKVAEALETFARSFIELRKGHEEFGRQMGVRTVHGDGPVERARDPRQLLALLLDPARDGAARELQGAFADYMVHQVAIVNGVVEGARGLLKRLDPEALEQEAQGGLWPMKAQALWKAFEARYRELADEEDALSDALFGREFGRAYTAVIGRTSKGDDEEPPGRAPPPRR